MDNLPKDSPDQNNNSAPASPASPNRGEPAGGPPPFGSGFTPHTNPIDPNNPYATQPPNPPTPSVHSEVAEHRPRDSHGHFLPYSQTTPTSPNIPNTPNTLPPLIETNPKEDTKDEDPPLIKVTNPVTYFKRWWNKLMSKEGIDFKMGFRIKPVTAVLIASVIITGGVSSGVTAVILKTFFPTSSPILHRQIVQQGTIQKTATGGFYLASSDSSMWKLKPKNPNINLADQVGRQVTVTGNMTKEANLIEVSEIILSDSSQTSLSLTPSQSPLNPPNNPNLPNIPNQDLLPKLYSGLQWDLTQRRVLIFTSGKRKIEQEGIYLESAQVTNLPQEFINYYTQQLSNSGFKETFNSSDPNGTTMTYAKDDLFLTFGLKNIYSGTGDNKKLTSYKAFIEHN